jgi:hypothetical protein
MGESSGTEICVQNGVLESFSVETPGGLVGIAERLVLKLASPFEPSQSMVTEQFVAPPLPR